jgi:predicted metal-binding protein
MPWAIVQPTVEAKVRGLCVHPYPGHRKGCPNFNKKDGCPPQAPLIHHTLDLSHPVYAIWNVFDFAGHVARMRELHPDWSQRQRECCLYWQPGARRDLRGEIARFLRQRDIRSLMRGIRVVACPEAQGVNLTATMRTAGIELEWPPVTVAYQIVLAGTPASETRGEAK